MMTQSTELLPVVQADRDRAWPFRPSCYKEEGRTRHNWNAGVYDKLGVIQAFAASRIEHSTPDRNAVLKRAAKMVDAMAHSAPSNATRNFGHKIAGAIVALTTTPEPTDPAGVSEMAEARDILSDLSSYLGAGLGDDGTTLAQYDDRIRWGIDHIGRVYRDRAAQVVEECSKRPGTTWGKVKRAILDDTCLPTASGREAPLTARTPSPVLEVAKEALEKMLRHSIDAMATAAHELEASAPLMPEQSRSDMWRAASECRALSSNYSAALQTINERAKP